MREARVFYYFGRGPVQYNLLDRRVQIQRLARSRSRKVCSRSRVSHSRFVRLGSSDSPEYLSSLLVPFTVLQSCLQL